MTGCVYWQIRHHGTVNTDDFHITTNKFVDNAYSYQGLLEGMSTLVAGIWMPLVYLSAGAQMEFFGRDFGLYHLVAAGIHAANAVILFLLLFQMTGALWKSALAAALFAVHPLNVEPVAWLACLRVIQSGFCCLLTLYFYALYAARRSSFYYTLSLFWYAASLFSVPMFPAVPFLLLLLDFWPLGRLGGKEKIGRAVWEKFPFFGIMAILLAIVMFSHNLSTSPGIDPYPLPERILNVFYAYVGFIQQTLIPFNIAVYYPFPDSFPFWKTGGAVLALFIITAISLRRVRRYPFLIIGWLWFAGMMFPLSGIAQIGTQSRSDHYAYIPLIGLLIFIVWGAAAVVEKRRLPGKPVAVASVIVIVLLAFVSWRQAGYWKDSETLMRHALKVTRNNFEAHNYLAQALADQGDLDAAVDHFKKALAIKPDHLKSHINLANVYISTGQADRAIYHLNRALEKDPTDARLYNNLGALYEKTGDARAALVNYRKAVALNPGYAPAYDNLAVVEANTGDLAGAVGHFQQALAINPRSAGTHFRLAVTLVQAGREEEAKQHLLTAITLDPANPQFRELLNLFRQGRPAALTGTEN